jgi:hypothetical protein
MGMPSNVIKEPRTFVGLAMYWPNSNQIFVTKVDFHTIVNRLLKTYGRKCKQQL